MFWNEPRMLLPCFCPVFKSRHKNDRVFCFDGLIERLGMWKGDVCGMRQVGRRAADSEVTPTLLFSVL